MEEKILASIKNLLGVMDDYTPFDEQIKVHINSVFMTLHQIGIGPEQPFVIYTGDERWKEFTGGDYDFQSVKTYVYLKLREVWDPPTVGVVSNSYEKQIREHEWRLLAQAEGVTNR